MKNSNKIAYQAPQFALLSSSQLQDLHLAALEVLRRTGIRFHHRGALDMLKEAGAFLSDGNSIKLPAQKVQQILAQAAG